MFVVYGGFLKWRISHDITIGIRQLFYWNPWFWDSTILENHHILIEFHHESTIKEVLDLHVEVDARSDTFAPASPHINTINCIQLHSIAIVEACEFGASKILIIRAIIPHICDMPDMRCPRCQWSFEWDNIKGTPFGQCLKKWRFHWKHLYTWGDFPSLLPVWPNAWWRDFLMRLSISVCILYNVLLHSSSCFACSVCCLDPFVFLYPPVVYVSNLITAKHPRAWNNNVCCSKFNSCCKKIHVSWFIVHLHL